ncbi:MAG: hypothetical protein GY804_11370 [Alphaproteobacteria bacterium]|nr:hypothetical protein [Alphaproteobacteria bacterium]
MRDINIMAAEFVKILGWVFPDLEWRESCECFVGRSATVPPHKAEKYNELFRIFKSGKESEHERLKNTTELDKKLKIAEEALKKSREDINWMLNSQKFLNPFVFDYIDTALKQIKGDS